MIYSLEPVNRYLTLDPIEKEEEEKEESLVLFPESHVTVASFHELYKVKSVAKDCSVSVFKGDVVVVNNQMIENVTFKEQTQHLILENYVLAVVRMD